MWAGVSPDRSILLRYSLLFVLASAVGAAPLAAQTAVQHLSLNGSWQFRQTASDPRAEGHVGTHPGTTDWHTATVPGVVQTDLLANKLIPPPFYRDNEAKLQWIGFANWEYQRTFSVSPQQLRQQHADLVFDGLDTFATVFVNDHQVLSTDNQFRIWRVDVLAWLHRGSNTVRVEFASPLIAPLAEIKARKYNLPANANSPWVKPFGVTTQNYTRKAPYNYGWDWGPRFITSGIWRPAEIEFWSAARIDNMYVRQLDISNASANLSIEAEIIASAPQQLAVDLDDSRWTPPPADGDNAPTEPAAVANAPALHQTVWLHAGLNHVVFPLNVDHPALWFPAGYGPQNMYAFHVQLKDGSRVLDSREAHTGLRSIELRRKADKWGRSFAFVVNGIPIFAKGANLIPFDSFPPRVTDAQMKWVLDSAVEAHMNMLRVWGGGYYGTDRFYELADERGLMLWQEFMFSDAIYPHDKAFFDNVHEEAIDQVRRLRNHPSLVLWCGNNEIEGGWHDWKNFTDVVDAMPLRRHDQEWGGYMHLFSGILPEVVAQYSTGTPYWPSSPSNDFTVPDGLNNDQYGDAHYWAVWHGRARFSSFNDQFPRFMSEYGFQSFPAMATIDTFTEPGDRSLLSPVMLAHQKNTEGNQLIKLYMGWEFPQPKDFPSFVYVSQVLQAEGIKVAAEHLRRNRPHVMGSLYWQLNDCWPVASWSSIDYFGRWKALQFYARRFYQDVLVSPHVRDGNVEVAVVSDRTQPFHGTVRVQLMTFAGNVVWHQDVPVDIQPLSAAQVWGNPQTSLLGVSEPSRVFVHTELIIAGENGGRPVSTNNFYFLPYKDLQLPAATLQTRWTTVDGKPALQLSSATLARDVYVDVGKLDAQPSDNFFDLLPGQTKTVTFKTAAPPNEVQQSAHVTSLTDAFASATPPPTIQKAGN